MPHDFRNKSFQKVLRGYAPDEVDDYIAYVNEEYRKLERRTADSERKLALALKKLDEGAKTGSADSVGPAAREAAAKLLREAEAERDRMIESARELANTNADGILENANAQADKIIAEAVEQAEAILAEAKAEAEAHRDDVKKAQDTARSIYGEIGSFREKLFALYNEHLDALEGVTDAAQKFMDGVDSQAQAGELPEPEEDADDDDVTEEELPEEENIEEVPADEEAEEEPAEEADAEPEFEPETAEDTAAEDETDEVSESDDREEEHAEAEENSLGDEVASNLAFMDRLFASLQSAEDVSGNDLYIDIPEDEDETDPEDAGDYFEEEEGFEAFDDIAADGELTEEAAGDDTADEELPAITIDWKKRSVVSAPETEEELQPVDESTDFRSTDGFEEFEEDYADEYADYEEEDFEENYDEYSPDGTVDEAADGEIAEDEKSEEEEAEEEAEDGEVDEYHEMDKIFNEDKSKREMSLTDEFNIIFDDSKSNQNVKEISRQPIVTPETPKNAKKRKKF